MAAKKKPDIQCVIYDCDGVLFDSLEANTRLYNAIAESAGRGVLTDAEVQYCHTHTVYEAIRHLFQTDPEGEKRALEFLKETGFLKFLPYLKMEPHLFEALDALKKKGVKRAICTNRTTSMVHVMEIFGLTPYFEMVVTALDVKHPKPHPSSAQKILEAFQIDKENALFIGDSEVDRETAVSAGIRFIAYKNEAISTSGNINDHLDLLTLLSDGAPRSQE
jgi:phosphoglycolate phosphatase